MDMLLTGNKRKTFTKLKQETFSNCQLVFRSNWSLLKEELAQETEKFTNHGIFDKFRQGRATARSRELQHLFLDKVFALRGKQTVVVLRTDIALESAHTPILRSGFGFIPLPSFVIKF